MSEARQRRQTFSPGSNKEQKAPSLAQFRIDVHHHLFPDFLDKSKVSAASGWRTPPENLPWSPEVSLSFMDRSGIDFAILSFPAVSIGLPGGKNRLITRQINDYAASICKQYSTRFGFFASLPILDDFEGCAAEISYCLDELHCLGFALPSSYGEGASARYVGHDDFDKTWNLLNIRKAVIFLHGSQTPSSTPWPHDTLGLPVSEVPNETFKAASHLVVTGRKRLYSNLKIILAHLGGSTLLLAPRVAALSNYMGCPLTPEEIIADFQSFYFDCALSAHEANLIALKSFAGDGRLLYGSDFPAVDTKTVDWYNGHIKKFYSRDLDSYTAVMFKNGLGMFPQLEVLVKNEGNVERAKL